MLPLSNASRIGFGCHLVSVDSQSHYDALLAALDSGCNLLDTSANYMQGKSEELIGKVLRENPQYDAFIVTKSGYDGSENLSFMEKGPTWSDIIHPDFLNNRIELSLRRLQRAFIDGFLLHSPESYMNPQDIQPFPDAFYAGVRRAFEFLETEAIKGRIRYYGISSNTFHLSNTNPDTIDLHRILRIANEISTDNHFKLIEFPFNLGEMDALKRNQGDKSLIQLARENGIVTLTNRPLNAKTAQGSIRLASYKEFEELLNHKPNKEHWDACLTLIGKQLRTLGVTDELMDFAILRHLNTSWTSVGNPEGVVQMFQNYFHPFLDHIYQGSIPSEDAKTYLNFYEAAILCSRRTMAQKTLDFRNSLVSKGQISAEDQRPLPVIACEIYLNSGVDHVLMGMRKPEYIEMMKRLF